MQMYWARITSKKCRVTSSATAVGQAAAAIAVKHRKGEFDDLFELFDNMQIMTEKKVTYLCVVRLLLDSTTVLEGLFGEYHSSSAALGKQRLGVIQQ